MGLLVPLIRWILAVGRDPRTHGGASTTMGSDGRTRARVENVVQSCPVTVAGDGARPPGAGSEEIPSWAVGRTDGVRPTAVGTPSSGVWRRARGRSRAAHLAQIASRAKTTASTSGSPNTTSSTLNGTQNRWVSFQP